MVGETPRLVRGIPEEAAEQEHIEQVSIFTFSSQIHPLLLSSLSPSSTIILSLAERLCLLPALDAISSRYY